MTVRTARALLLLGLTGTAACPRTDPGGVAFVGRAACAACHAAEDSAWRGSHHDLAMQEAREATVLGDFGGATYTYNGVTSVFAKRGDRFIIRTDGPDGQLRDYEVAYTFGVYPLQQYLIALPGGRYQALSLAWDARQGAQGGQRWFHLYPGERVDHGDVLHWTRASQNWNTQCAECHSTNLKKGYDARTNRYRTTWSELNVSCEACHGPGSRHVAWARRGDTGQDAGLVARLGDREPAGWVFDSRTGIARRDPARSSRAEVETCARCHARRGVISEEYVAGRPLTNTHRVSLLEAGLYQPDGQILDEVYEYGSFLQSRMYAAGVTCSDCHDPHRPTIVGSPDAVCGRCHLRERFFRRAHHFHEPGTRGASCVACHMPGRTYMVVDYRRDHSLRVPRPDLSVTLGTPNACTGCHTNRDAAWAAAAVRRWYGRTGPGRPRPHYGEALHAGRIGRPDAERALVRLVEDGAQPGIVRGSALELLGRYLSPASLPVVEAALHDPDPLVRLGALAPLDRLDPGGRHRLALPLLDDSIRSVRVAAARAVAPEADGLAGSDRVAFERAFAEFRAAQAVNADRPEAHLNLGVVHALSGEPDDARREYDAALRLEPAFVPAYVNLADLHRQQGRDDAGERVLREGLARQPAAADLHYALGLLLVRRQRLTEALPALREAATLRPDEPRYAYAYGLALQSAGQPAGAYEVLRDAARRFPGDRELLAALGFVSGERGDSTGQR
ncbi:MAG: tetratricopeptide repeat protein [Gemmatimonadales bacterium]